MNLLLNALETRFGQETIKAIQFKGERFYSIDLSKEKSVKLLITSRLHEYQMPLPEKLNGYEFGELFACLPAYWDVTNPNDDNVNWAYEWLFKILTYTTEKQTWIGDGHTYDCTKYSNQLSQSLKQDHLFISSPMYLETELTPVQNENKTIHFWGIIPIFSDEMDFKQSKI